MKKLVLILVLLSQSAIAGVPYYRDYNQEGKQCRYFYSGNLKYGMEELVSVQCFDN